MSTSAGISRSLVAALAGRYTIERQLGRGGMATVYLAHDLRHDRPVALKILHPELAASLGPERFQREIRLASRLQHPHILPVHDSGQADGALYYVMPFVEGESLRARLEREGRLAVPEAARILSEVADGLAHAHARGFVHRDVKPENVLLSSGHAVVADFGVAKALDEVAARQGDTTTAGVAIGTPTYMAPEQASADPTLDHRADIYALGVMGYELLAGQPPFARRTPQATLIAHAMEHPRPIDELRPEVPAQFATILERCLAKAPAERPRSAAEVSETLRAFATPASGAMAIAFPPRHRRTNRLRRYARRLGRPAVILAAALLAGVALWRAGVRIEREPAAGVETAASAAAATAATPPRSVAVLPLVEIGGDTAQDYFADGMTDELTGALSRVPGLRVASRTSAFVFKGRGDVDVREIGRRLNVEAVLEGTVRRVGDRLRVNLQLTNVDDGLTYWSDTYERPLTEVFTLQDEAAAEVVEVLAGRPGVARAGGAAPPTRDLEAYDLYLRAEFFYHRITEPDLRKALALYEAAIARDSSFAAAWAGVSKVWAWLADDWVPPREAYPKARAAAERALALDSTLADAHGALAVVLMLYERDLPAAERAIRRELALARTAAVYYDYADFLGITGRLDEAIAVASEARRLSPVDPQTTTLLGDMLVRRGRYDEAVAEYRRALELEPAHAFALIGMANARTAQGRPDEALRILRRAPEAGLRVAVARGRALAGLGRRAEAQRVVRALEAESRRRYVRPSGIASIYAALGDLDAAFRWLERALAERSAGVVWLRAEPWWAPVRADPRFAALWRKVGLE